MLLQQRHARAAIWAQGESFFWKCSCLMATKKSSLKQQMMGCSVQIEWNFVMWMSRCEHKHHEVTFKIKCFM